MIATHEIDVTHKVWPSEEARNDPNYPAREAPFCNIRIAKFDDADANSAARRISNALNQGCKPTELYMCVLYSVATIRTPVEPD